MPWVPLDTHYVDDPKIQAAGALTPFAMSVFPALLAAAKQVSQGGSIEVSFRKLAFDLFISEDEAEKGVKALVSAGVLTCPQLSGGSITVKFVAWRRWNERFRKASQRAADSHE